MDVELSVIVPVYNEESSLPSLFKRLKKSMDKIGKVYELIFVNDASEDGSLYMLENFSKGNDNTKIVNFHRNKGQHMAIIAGMKEAQGDIVITIDADMQTPPEEIHKVIEKMGEGFDYVGTFRDTRKDNFFRTYISKLVNWFRENILDVQGMKDHGCMLRCFQKKLVQKILKRYDEYSFVPILAYSLCDKYSEIEMKHLAREFGNSNYSCSKLITTSFYLMTSASIKPLHIITFTGIALTVLSGFVLLLMTLFFALCLVKGFTLTLVLIVFLLSFILMAIGIVGEYIIRVALPKN